MDYMFSTVIFTTGFMFCCIQQPCRANQQGGTNKFPVIWTSYGPIRGQQFISPWTNKTIYAFKGIPYATAPIGELRFQDPLPVKKWSQVRDGTREGAICPQPSTYLIPPDATQSEDCLYVNVYTPQIIVNGQVPLTRHELLPVIVFIHGGTFLFNSGDYYGNGPDFLVAEEIVFVSINYRLGALGFLNLGISGAAGNAGLKDQRLALVWVQSEIQHFGGDPQQVTLFGESVGAICCHLHYISPLSVGLFHRAIGDSGSAISYHTGVRADAALYGLMLADRLNCSTRGKWSRHQSPRRNTDPPPLPGVETPYIDSEVANNALRCLRAADYQDIVTAQLQVTDPLGDITGMTVFGPTIDKYSSKEPFLLDFPFKLLEQKKGLFVPFLMGINSDEGILRVRIKEGEINNITNNYEYLYGLEVPQSCIGKLKAEKLRRFYHKYNVPSELNVKSYVDVYTDVQYAYGTTVTVRNYQNSANVFLYYFSFNGKFKYPDNIAVETEYHYSGVTHMEELNYLFLVEGVDQIAPYNSNEMKTLHRMVKMWTNFAKYGTPTVEPDPLLQNVQWLPARGGRTNHLHIDVNLRMASEDLLAPRAALWDSITFNHCS